MGIAELSDQDLVSKLAQDQRDLVAARFKHSTNQLENTSSLRDLRRGIARMKAEAGRREAVQGLSKNALFAKFRPVSSDTSGSESTKSSGGFLQGIVDKISGDE